MGMILFLCSYFVASNLWMESLCFLVVNFQSCSWSIGKTWPINFVWGIYNQTLSMVTLPLRPVVPWAWHLLLGLLCGLNLVLLVQITMEEDRTVPVGNQNWGEKKGQWSPALRAKAARVAQRIHLCIQKWLSSLPWCWWKFCPGLHEGSSCRSCCWYLEIHPLLNWCCFNCSVGEQKNILNLVISYPGENDEVSQNSFGPASVSNVTKESKELEGKEQFSMWIKIKELMLSDKKEDIPMENIFLQSLIWRAVILCKDKTKAYRAFKEMVCWYNFFFWFVHTVFSLIFLSYKKSSALEEQETPKLNPPKSKVSID